MFPKIGVPQNGWFIAENPIKISPGQKTAHNSPSQKFFPRPAGCLAKNRPRSQRSQSVIYFVKSFEKGCKYNKSYICLKKKLSFDPYMFKNVIA